MKPRFYRRERVYSYSNKELYNKIKPQFTRVIPSGAFKLLDFITELVYTVKANVRKGITHMGKLNKANAGLYFNLLIVSVVIILNELAAFLYVRDNVSNQTIAIAIAGFSVFCSVYIVFTFIGRLLRK